MPPNLSCLVATGNAHKTEEIGRILKGLPLELIDLSSLDPIDEPEETGITFLENAQLKARYYSELTGLIALADDSGLEVDALHGEPGVYSARFAGPESSHEVKMRKILDLLAETPENQRTARFRCVAVARFPDGREFHAEGSLEGTIHREIVGVGGFGYDPIVYIPSLKKTVAELSDQEKDRLSHRGQAFRHLFDQIQDQF